MTEQRNPIPEHGFYHLGDILKEYYQLVESDTLLSTRTVPTHLIELDRITGGLQRSEMTVLGGVPKVGKTSLALQIALNAAAYENHQIAFFNLDPNSSRKVIAEQALANRSGVNIARIQEGKLSESEIEELSDAAFDLEKYPINLSDEKNLTTEEISQKSHQIADGSGVDLIIIDSLQFVKSSSNIPRDLRVLARELDVPLLATAGLTDKARQYSPYFPGIYDLAHGRDSDSIVDLILMMHREELIDKDTDRKGIVDLQVAKNRNGPTGKISFYFEQRSLRFKNLEYQTTTQN